MARLLDTAPVVPVVMFEDAAHAVGTARALADGGVPIIEVTLRTPVALAAIERIAAEVPDIELGAGTITSPDQAQDAVDAGARFLVTPGCTDAVLDAAVRTEVPVLPGAATVSEAMRLAERGFTELKFFPAAPAGGPAYLRAIRGPLPHLRFCPTGGITAETASEYLALPNVGCVGGSWLTPADAVARGDTARITALAKARSCLLISSVASGDQIGCIARRTTSPQQRCGRGGQRSKAPIWPRAAGKRDWETRPSAGLR